MRTSTSCGWCHAMNPVAERFCKECGHEAHVSRLLCRCPRCARQQPADQGDAASITTATEALQAVLTDLRAGQRQNGMNPGATFPRELALGNVMRLKRPYWSQSRRQGRDKPFVYGLIVQQLHNSGGIWVVSLHLYDEDGVLHLHPPSQVPVYVDLPANELILHKIASECGYRVVNHDLYPAREGEYGFDFSPLPG